MRLCRTESFEGNRRTESASHPPSAKPAPSIFLAELIEGRLTMRGRYCTRAIRVIAAFALRRVMKITRIDIVVGNSIK